MAPLKVLLAHNLYQIRGGEETAYEQDIRVLERHGHTVVRFGRDNREILDYGALEHGRLVARTIWNRETKRELSALLRRERPDVAHFYNTFPLISPSAYSACRGAGVPVVQTLANYRLVCLNAFLFRDGHLCELCVGRVPWRGVMYRCYRDSTAQSGLLATTLMLHRGRRTWARDVALFTTPSPDAIERLVQGGVPRERIVVMRNFADPDPGARPSSVEGSVFVYAGRLSPEKGIATLLDAFGTTREAPLKIVGDGPARPLVERAIRERGLSNVELLGRVERARATAIMRDARAVLVPSQWLEVGAPPLVVLEALASGVPVIASDLVAGREALEEMEGCIPVPAADVAEWARKIRLAWEHPAEAAALGVKARATYERHYSPERGYRRLIDVYTQAIAHAAARR